MKIKDLLDDLYLQVGGRPFEVEWLRNFFGDTEFLKLRAVIHSMRMCGESRCGYSVFDTGVHVMLVKEYR